MHREEARPHDCAVLEASLKLCVQVSSSLHFVFPPNPGVKPLPPLLLKPAHATVSHSNLPLPLFHRFPKPLFHTQPSPPTSTSPHTLLRERHPPHTAALNLCSHIQGWEQRFRYGKPLSFGANVDPQAPGNVGAAFPSGAPITSTPLLSGTAFPLFPPSFCTSALGHPLRLFQGSEISSRSQLFLSTSRSGGLLSSRYPQVLLWLDMKPPVSGHSTVSSMDQHPSGNETAFPLERQLPRCPRAQGWYERGSLPGSLPSCRAPALAGLDIAPGLPPSVTDTCSPVPGKGRWLC